MVGLDEGIGRPDWVRLMDRVGQELWEEAPGLVRLDPEDLLEAATKTTGLSDFGTDASWFVPMS